MEGIVSDHRRIVLAGAVAIAAAVAVFVAMSGDEPVAVAPNAPLPGAPPLAQTPSPPAAQPPSSAAEAPVAEDAAPAQAELALACPEITGGDLPQRLTEECFAALEAHFTARPGVVHNPAGAAGVDVGALSSAGWRTTSRRWTPPWRTGLAPCRKARSARNWRRVARRGRWPSCTCCAMSAPKAARGEPMCASPFRGPVSTCPR